MRGDEKSVILVTLTYENYIHAGTTSNCNTFFHPFFKGNG